MDVSQLLSSLHYNSQKPEKVAPHVEEAIRQELGAPTPIPYQVLPGASGGATAGSLLSEWAHAQMHMSQQAAPLFYIQFALAWPRPFELQVGILRHGMGALAGRCVFAIPLAKRVPGPLSLVELKFGQAGGFAGDPALTARLNSNRDLLAKAYGLLATKASIGSTRLSIPHYFQIQPSRTGSLLMVHRLPRPGLLSGANWGVKDLLAFAPMLEYYL